MEKGSLDRILHQKHKEKLSLQQKIQILSSVAKGMAYLHSIKPKMIIHRDLKPGNILLDKHYNAKVCDFGLSKVMGSLSESMTANIGTLYYIAPELLSDSQQSGMGTKLDVYSFAIIMWEVLFEQFLYSSFHSSSLFSISNRVMKGIRPEIPFSNTDQQVLDWISMAIPSSEVKQYDTDHLVTFIEDYIELMKQCWDQDATLRPDFNTITQTISNLWLDLTTGNSFVK